LLEQHKFKITYTLGKDNRRVDALSRRYDIAGTKIIEKETILKINHDSTLSAIIKCNNILLITNKVPKELQEAIIVDYHDNLIYRHSSVTRIIELI
jgi:hypothetical protein